MKEIDRLKKKVKKIENKILNLEKQEYGNKRKEAFDTIMELGEKYNLFREVEREFQFSNNTETVKLTVESPLEMNFKRFSR